MARINFTSDAVRQAIVDKSAANLPFNPSAAGMTPEDIRRMLYAPITDTENSLLSELQRVIKETNSALGQVGAGGSSGGSTGDGSSCDCVAPQIRINSQTGFWEVSYDGGYSWESLGVDAVGDDGEDGVTPQLRINASTNYWEVSYDNGSSWTSLGVKATGEGSGGGSSGSGAGIQIEKFEYSGTTTMTGNMAQFIFSEYIVDPCNATTEPGQVKISTGRDLNGYKLIVSCDGDITYDFISATLWSADTIFLQSYGHVMVGVYIDDATEIVSVVAHRVDED